MVAIEKRIYSHQRSIIYLQASVDQWNPKDNTLDVNYSIICFLLARLQGDMKKDLYDIDDSEYESEYGQIPSLDSSDENFIKGREQHKEELFQADLDAILEANKVKLEKSKIYNKGEFGTYSSQGSEE